MEKRKITEADIREEIRKKAERIRRKNYEDAYICERYQTYRNIYRSAVEYGTDTVVPYVLYKAFEEIAKERDLL